MRWWPFSKKVATPVREDPAVPWKRPLNDAMSLRRKGYDWVNRELADAMIGGKNYSMKTLNDILGLRKEGFIKDVIGHVHAQVKSLSHSSAIESHPQHARIVDALRDLLKTIGDPDNPLGGSLVYAVNAMNTNTIPGGGVASSHDLKAWLEMEWRHIEPYIENVVRSANNAWKAFES